MTCACGCGERTNLAPQTDRKKGWVKGEPMRFVAGHQNRGRYGPLTKDYDIDPDTGCWVWAKRWRTANGYGCTGRGGRTTTAHRFYYEQRHGPIPAGMVIDHLCRNRLCVNPDHLEAVTQQENLRRGLGTKLSEADVQTIRESGEPVVDLARRFGIHPTYCYAVRIGRERKAAA